MDERQSDSVAGTGAGTFRPEPGGASSLEVARAAIRLAISADREEERVLKEEYRRRGIRTAAVDHGGEYVGSIRKLIEKAVVAAKREGIVGESHLEEGAVAGAAHEAVSHFGEKALGLNIGGKMGLASQGEHVVVAFFANVGLLHLNEVGVSMAHRPVPRRPRETTPAPFSNTPPSAENW